MTMIEFIIPIVAVVLGAAAVLAAKWLIVDPDDKQDDHIPYTH